MRVERSHSANHKREYITAEFNGHDVLAALAEYVTRHDFMTEEELKGFRLVWAFGLKCVDGRGITPQLQLKSTREVNSDKR